MNTLQEAYEKTQAQFPGWWVLANQELCGDGQPISRFRVSIVKGSQVYGESGDTLQAAFDSLVASYNKPKDAEIDKARAFLASLGYQVSKANRPAL